MRGRNRYLVGQPSYIYHSICPGIWKFHNMGSTWDKFPQLSGHWTRATIILMQTGLKNEIRLSFYCQMRFERVQMWLRVAKQNYSCILSKYAGKLPFKICRQANPSKYAGKLTLQNMQASSPSKICRQALPAKYAGKLTFQNMQASSPGSSPVCQSTAYFCTSLPALLSSLLLPFLSLLLHSLACPSPVFSSLLLPSPALLLPFSSLLLPRCFHSSSTLLKCYNV